MDGEDLIICLAIWTLNKRRRPLTFDDFRAVSIASRNRLRSRLNFFAPWGDFGRFLEAKMEAKIEFLGSCLHCLFRSPSGIDLGSFLGGPKPGK